MLGEDASDLIKSRVRSAKAIAPFKHFLRDGTFLMCGSIKTKFNTNADNGTLPDWAKTAVFYQIYPQSFKDTNGDGVGDLPGVIEKLDYIKRLGVNAIWISPFYLSPMRDAGYDVADYRAVHPRYGSLDDVQQLFREAHLHGIRVILDFIPGHTSIDHPWFKESARNHPPRPYKNWYIWTDSAWDDGGDPWNKSIIHGYSNRDGNYLVNFFWSQPALNFGFAEPEPDKPWQLATTHDDVQALWREMRSIMHFWMELGADGFRVDMADSLIRNDPDTREIRRFWRETREELEEAFPEIFLIAEGDPSNLLDGTGFHSAFLHWTPSYWGVFRKGETYNQELGKMKTEAYFDCSCNGDFRPYLQAWKDEHAKIGKGCVITTPVGNHDLPRVAIGQSEEDLEIVFAFQCAWPGIPFIYYGDEIGMQQMSSENPIHEGHYPTRNGARTPMQWENTYNCGFSSGPSSRLYLPVDSEPESRTVENQEKEPSSLLHKVRRLIEIHRANPAFSADATIEFLSEGAPGEPLVFIRGHKEQRILCYFLPAETSHSMMLPSGLSHSQLRVLACGGSIPEISEGVISAEGPLWIFWNISRRR